MAAEQFRMQFFVDSEVVKRLDKLGEGMGMTRNEVGAWLVRVGVSDEEWIINRMASRINAAFGKRTERKPVVNGE